MFKLNKTQKKRFVLDNFLIVIGSILLAFGTAIFLTRLNIVAGGLSGIGIIVQHFVSEAGGPQIIDFIVFGLSWILWIIGFVFISKKFALKTLVSTAVYPLALSLFLRVQCFLDFADIIATYGATGGQTQVGILLLCAVFGGVFVGSGMALTFLGGGSSGGMDIILILMSKKGWIKESVSSIICDAAIILVAMFAIPNNIVPGLCGILCALTTSLCIEVLYVLKERNYQADIISDRWEEISRYVQDVLGRGVTVIQAKGGYKGEERIVLRVVFDRYQYFKIRNMIYKIDPKAFVTYTHTEAVHGEGFTKYKK